MATISSFLSEGFLKEFIEDFPRDFFSDEFPASIAIYRFLDKHTDVALSGKKEDYVDLIQTDGLVRNLINRYLQGDDSVKFKDWEKELPPNAKPFPFFFLTSLNNTLKTHLNQEGLPSYQLKNTQTLKQITGYEAIPVTTNSNFSNRLSSWEDLKGKLLPFHSLVMVDNYLLSQANKHANPVQDSIIPLLRSIMEGSGLNEKKIYITLICFHQYKKGKYEGKSDNDWEKKEKKKKEELIKKTITLSSDIKENLDCHFTNSNLFDYSVAILDDSSSFHDRIIITNGQFLTSGNSFGHYFNSKGKIKLKSPTILNLNSHACTYNDTKWSEIATQMLETLKMLIKDSSTTKVGNPLDNPLLV